MKHKLILECYESATGRQPFRWRLKARNQKIIADGAEGYSSAAALFRAVWRLKRAGLCAEVRAIK